MDKTTFFKQIHREIAERYDIDKNLVAKFRSSILGFKRNKEQFIEFLEEKIKNSYILHSHTQKKWVKEQLQGEINRKNNFIDFLENITEEQLQDILQKTECDK